MTTTRQIVMVSSGLSDESATNRLGEALVNAIERHAAQRGIDIDVTRIYVRDLAQHVASASLSGFASGDLADAYDVLGHADAVLALTPTFKASYTGLFKAFWDATEDGLIAGVPTFLGATGGSERHSLMTDTAMRPLFAYLGAHVLPTTIYAATSDWAGTQLMRRVERAADEIVGALVGDAAGSEPPTVSAQRRESVTNPFGNVPTMAQMLSGQ